MKKITLAIVLFTLLAALAACTNSSVTTNSTTTTSLSEEAQLLVGTLNLESTNLAVTTTQAAQLLPLWETLQSLATSGTAASQEIQAVVDQIKSSMNAEQLSKITAMGLTTTDLQAAISANGASASTTASTSSGSTSANQSQPGGSLGAPAGSAPTGGNPLSDLGGSALGIAAGAGVSGSTPSSSSQAGSGKASTSSSEAPLALINALVQLLQKKAG